MSGKFLSKKKKISKLEKIIEEHNNLISNISIKAAKQIGHLIC